MYGMPWAMVEPPWSLSNSLLSVNLLAQGRARVTITPLLAGVGLVALPKPFGGIRSIAVGELFRRLTAKYLIHEMKVNTKNYFWLAQAGVIIKARRSRSCCASTSHLGWATRRFQ